MKPYKHKISLGSSLKIAVPEEKDKYLALASIDKLKPFLPNIDIKKNYDLLPIVSTGFVANRWNLNGHGVTGKTAIELAKTFIYKGLDLDHSLDRVVGVLLNYGFSEYGTDKPLEESEVENLTKPFNVVFGGVVWINDTNEKVVNYLIDANDPESPDYLIPSLSWEVMFDEYDLGVIEGKSRNFEDARIISDPEEIAKLDKHLPTNNGKGKINANTYLYQIPKGEKCVGSGMGIVTVPASEAHGILVGAETEEASKEIAANSNKDNKTELNSISNTIQSSNDSITVNNLKSMIGGGEITHSTAELLPENEVIIKSKSNRDVNLDEKNTILAKNQDKNENNSNNVSQTQKSDVIIDTIAKRFMKISKIQDVNDEVLKTITASSIHEYVLPLEKEIKEANEKYIASQNEKKEKETKLNEVLATVEGLTKEVNQFKTEKAEREKQEALNVRMASLDESYELDAEDRKVIVAQIKDLDQPAFDSYQKNMKVLMKEKSKEFKAKAATVTTTIVASAQTTVDAALDNATKTSATVPNTSDTKPKSLKDKYAAAFAPDQFVVVSKRKQAQ